MPTDILEDFIPEEKIENDKKDLNKNKVGEEESSETEESSATADNEDPNLPLVMAARLRQPDTLLHLLQLDPGSTQLQDVLEMLLFAPHQLNLTDHDRDNIERCMEYITRAVQRMDKKGLLSKEEDGYFTLHQNWKDILPHERIRDPCDLKHICRGTIRRSLHNDIPQRLMTLPLPNLILNYLDLQY